MNSTQVVPLQEFEVIPLALSWRTLLRVSAYGELALLILTTVALRDVLAAGLSVLLLIGLGVWFLRRRSASPASRIALEGVMQMVELRFHGEKVSALLLGALFADIGFYTLTGAVSNLLNRSDWYALALPASLATFAVTGFVSAIVILFSRGNTYTPSDLARNLAIAVALVLTLVLTLGLFTRQPTTAAAATGGLELTAENLAYSETSLVAPGSLVTVSLQNHDLFWHTFTIDALKVDLKVPMQARQQIQFNAAPGTYTFHCTIPGHEVLGMRGTLLVKQDK